MNLENRRADFSSRAKAAAENPYSHPLRPIRFIPVHAFADEGAPAIAVDAWCEFPTDVALVEAMTVAAAKREEGIWIRRDGAAPHFLKIFAVLDCPAIKREHFESVLTMVADHSRSRDGFATIQPGLPLEPLSTNEERA